MKQQEIHSYLRQFFTTNNCPIEEDTGNYLTVQLTIDMDKQLMNRPFYWHYIEKTGGTPNPQKLTLITDFHVQAEIKGEPIHFGSPRLHQIFSIVQKQSGYIRLFENLPWLASNHTPLIPWLCINLKISFICDRRRDVFKSLGVNLINGMLVEQFHQRLLEKKVNLVAKIPDFSFTFTPLIKPLSGYRRIQQYIENEIMKEDSTWAKEARERWEKDEKLLNAFYEEESEKPERYYIEKEALQDQYEPKIDISVINGGLFYLTNGSLNGS